MHVAVFHLNFYHKCITAANKCFVSCMPSSPRNSEEDDTWQSDHALDAVNIHIKEVFDIQETKQVHKGREAFADVARSSIIHPELPPRLVSAHADKVVRKELLTGAEFYRVEGILNELKPRPFKESASILSSEQRQTLIKWLKNTDPSKVPGSAGEI